MSDSKQVMEYKTLVGKNSRTGAAILDKEVNRHLKQGWELMSEIDGGRGAFSGGKALGGALLLGPIGLAAGLAGKSGTVKVRLQRPINSPQAVTEKAQTERRTKTAWKWAGYAALGVIAMATFPVSLLAIAGWLGWVSWKKHKKTK